MAGRKKADVPAAQGAQNSVPKETLSDIWYRLKAPFKVFLLNMYAFDSQVAAARELGIETAVTKAQSYVDRTFFSRAIRLRKPGIKSQMEVANLMLADTAARSIATTEDGTNFKLVKEATKSINDAYRALKSDDPPPSDSDEPDWGNLSIIPQVEEVEDA